MSSNNLFYSRTGVEVLLLLFITFQSNGREKLKIDIVEFTLFLFLYNVDMIHKGFVYIRFSEQCTKYSIMQDVHKNKFCLYFKDEVLLNISLQVE